MTNLAIKAEGEAARPPPRTKRGVTATGEGALAVVRVGGVFPEATTFKNEGEIRDVTSRGRSLLINRNSDVSRICSSAGDASRHSNKQSFHFRYPRFAKVR